MKRSTDDILFILGAPRSGTTHLARLVSQAFGYGMGPEGQFVLRFARKLDRYGNLARPEKLRRLVVDISYDMMFTTLREQYGVNVTVADILDRTDEPTYAGVVEAVFRAIADRRALPRIGSKYPDFALNLQCLESLFPGRARYLCIVRDGRDVFLSLQGVPWGRMSAYAAAKRWVHTDESVQRFAESHGTERLLCVRYEDVVSNVSETLEKISSFLKITVPADIHASLIETKSERMIYERNYNKWKSSMSQRNQYIYESIAGETLRRHGYETRFSEPVIGASWVLAYEFAEISRLVRVNIYHAKHRQRPGDVRRID